MCADQITLGDWLRFRLWNIACPSLPTSENCSGLYFTDWKKKEPPQKINTQKRLNRLETKKHLLLVALKSAQKRCRRNTGSDWESHCSEEKVRSVNSARAAVSSVLDCGKKSIIKFKICFDIRTLYGAVIVEAKWTATDWVNGSSEQKWSVQHKQSFHFFEKSHNLYKTA